MTWKAIKLFESYSINEQGKIRSLNYNKTNKVKELKHDGLYCVLHKNGVARNIKIGRLVAQAFLGLDIEDKNIYVIHKDLNKKNNNKDNLLLIKKQYAQKYYLNNNVLFTHKKKRTDGDYLSETKRIILLREAGNTYKVISNLTGFSQSYVCMIFNKKRRVYKFDLEESLNLQFQ